MAQTPASVTQRRVIELFSLQAATDYTHAAEILKAAGLPADGVPAGETWRTVKKMTDEELMAKLPTPRATGIVERPAFKRKTWGDRIREQKERERLNQKLRAAGFRWSKEQVSIEFDAIEEPADADFGWVLRDPQGNEVSLGEAKRRLGLE